MRNRRVEEIRKRIAKRKAEQQKHTYPSGVEVFTFEDEEEISQPVAFIDQKEPVPPLFRKEIFLLKLLCAACLVLGAAILFKNSNPSFDKARTVVQTVMREEFKFASVSKWYEGQFGKPLTLLPSSKQTPGEEKQDYAVPASGKLLQPFQANGQGVFVQTNINATVDAVNEGIVIFAGNKEDLGNTVIIQHADGTESWYGGLSEQHVSLYDYVKKKQRIGKVQNSEDGKAGTFYFAFKKEEKFIDPIQVIPLE
ncbi:MAG: peptidoglycan DD-metalloendopeptidase family protein [Ectobacillus sp.]